MRDFMRVALERDARSLAFLDEVRSRPAARPAPRAPSGCAPGAGGRPGGRTPGAEARHRPAPAGRREVTVVFDGGSESDARALERLATDMIGWLTTVTPDGQPQTFPIWFLWEDGEVLIYSDRRAKRNVNIAGNPRVSLHLNDDGRGGDVVVVEGEARVDHTTPPVPPARGLPRQVRRLDRRVPQLGRGDGDHLQRPDPDPADPRQGVRRCMSVAARATGPAHGRRGDPRPPPGGPRRGGRALRRARRPALADRVEAGMNPVRTRAGRPGLGGGPRSSTPPCASPTSTRTRLLFGPRPAASAGTAGHVDVPRLIEGGVALQVLSMAVKTPRGLNIERNDGRDRRRAGDRARGALAARDLAPAAAAGAPPRRTGAPVRGTTRAARSGSWSRRRTSPPTWRTARPRPR